MCIFNKYSEIFGISRKGVHKIRFLDAAAFDYVVAILLAVILSKITRLPIVISTIIMFIIGIVLHALFGVNTSAVKFLNLNC